MTPDNPGYAGRFALNDRLTSATRISVAPHHGPEAVAVASDGMIYTGTEGGQILRIDPKTSKSKVVGTTGGRPLGLAFGPQGQLYIADAYRGLLQMNSTGQLSVLADRFQGQPIAYADDLDVAKDGKVYFSDASTKFSAKTLNSPFEASRLDINEHGGTGRLLVYDPASSETKLVFGGLNFANGVALSHDGESVLVCETGHYRVVRHWLKGPKAGRTETLIGDLPGFPDNITRGTEGRYWIGMISPRSKALDAISEYPFLRKMVVRLPRWIQPDARAHGHVIAVDDGGRIVANLQDPSGAVAFTSGATEARGDLYVSMLRRPFIARVPLAQGVPSHRGTPVTE